MKAARGRQGTRKCRLIEANCANRDRAQRPGRTAGAPGGVDGARLGSVKSRARLSVLSSAAPISRDEAAAAGGRVIMTASHPVRILLRRTRSCSRIRRRMRLRTTAPPTRLLVEIPTRKASPPEGRRYIAKNGCDHARPSRRTRRTSASLARRFSLRTAPPGQPARSETVALGRLDDGQALPAFQPPAIEHVAARAR